MLLLRLLTLLILGLQLHLFLILLYLILRLLVLLLVALLRLVHGLVVLLRYFLFSLGLGRQVPFPSLRFPSLPYAFQLLSLRRLGFLMQGRGTLVLRLLLIE